MTSSPSQHSSLTELPPEIFTHMVNLFLAPIDFHPEYTKTDQIEHTSHFDVCSNSARTNLWNLAASYRQARDYTVEQRFRVLKIKVVRGEGWEATWPKEMLYAMPHVRYLELFAERDRDMLWGGDKTIDDIDEAVVDIVKRIPKLRGLRAPSTDILPICPLQLEYLELPVDLYDYAEGELPIPSDNEVKRRVDTLVIADTSMSKWLWNSFMTAMEENPDRRVLDWFSAPKHLIVREISGGFRNDTRRWMSPYATAVIAGLYRGHEQLQLQSFSLEFQHCLTLRDHYTSRDQVAQMHDVTEMLADARIAPVSVRWFLKIACDNGQRYDDRPLQDNTAWLSGVPGEDTLLRLRQYLRTKFMASDHFRSQDLVNLRQFIDNIPSLRHIAFEHRLSRTYFHDRFIAPSPHWFAPFMKQEAYFTLEPEFDVREKEEVMSSAWAEAIMALVKGEGVKSEEWLEHE